MARGKRQVTDQMLKAGQAGEQATQRSHESRISSSHQRATRAQQQAQFDEGIEQQNLNRWQRQWEEKRKNELQQETLDRKFPKEEKRDGSIFGGRNVSNFNQGAEAPPDAKLEENKRQFDQTLAEKQRQFDQSTELSAATHGMERAPERNPSGNPGPDNTRLGALQDEMRRRGDNQMGQGVEQRGRSGFVPTQASKDKTAQEANLAEREMRVKEMQGAARLQQARTSYERLGVEVSAAKTAAARKELAAKQKVVEETLMQPIKSDAGRLDRFMKGDQTTLDVQTLRKMLEGVPPVGLSRALHDEVKAGVVGPATTRFLGEKIAASAIEFAYATGKLPDGDLVDLSSAGMQEFSKSAKEARSLLLPETVAGKIFTGDQQFDKEQVEKIKRGYPDHVQMVTKLAALLVLKQQRGIGASAALGQEQKPTHEQRRADPAKPFTPAERAGQITPEEAGRRAEEGGGRAAPKTGKKPYKPTPAGPSYGTRGGLSGNLPYGV